MPSDDVRTTSAYYHNHVFALSQHEDTVNNLGKPISSHLYMARHTYLGPLMSDPYSQTKAFFNTNVTMAVNNHHVMRCLNTPPDHYTCPGHLVDPNHSLMVHYRRGNGNKNSNCTKQMYGTDVQDTKCGSHNTVIWQHLHQLRTRVEHKMTQIFGDKQ